MGKKDPRVDAYIKKAAPFAQPILAEFREIVHTACPGVEETMKLPDCVSAVPEMVSVEVPERPPVAFAQNGKLFAVIAELEEMAPAPQVEVAKVPVVPTVTHGFPPEPSSESETAPPLETVRMLLDVAMVRSIVDVAEVEVPRNRLAFLSKPARTTLDDE